MINQDVDCVRLLLKNGADPADQDELGETALHKALLLPDLSIAHMIITEAWSPSFTEIVSAQGLTFLHYAVQICSLSMSSLFITKGVPVDHKSSEGNTALHLAINTLASETALLQKITDREEREAEDARMEAALLNQQSSKMTDGPKTRRLDDQTRDSALSSSTTQDTKDFISSDPSKRRDEADPLSRRGGGAAEFDDNDGQSDLSNSSSSKGKLKKDFQAPNSPLTICHQVRKTDKDKMMDLIELLLERGASGNIFNNRKESPVHIAAKIKDSDCLELILKFIYRLDLGNGKEITPLHSAASFGSLSCTSLLLERHFQAGITDSEGSTPLHLAASNGHSDVLGILLNNKSPQVSIDVRDNRLQTPLHRAAASNHPACIKILLQAGAGVMFADKNGDQPLHLAAASPFSTPLSASNSQLFVFSFSFLLLI